MPVFAPVTSATFPCMAERIEGPRCGAPRERASAVVVAVAGLVGGSVLPLGELGPEHAVVVAGEDGAAYGAVGLLHEERLLLAGEVGEGAGAGDGAAPEERV